MARFQVVFCCCRENQCSVVPLAIDGSWDAWNGHRKWPRLGDHRRHADGNHTSRGPERMEESKQLEHLKREVEKLRLEVRAICVGRLEAWPKLWTG